MANSEYDRCKNCFYWRAGECESTKNVVGEIGYMGWCFDHMRKNPLDKGDPAVLHDYIVLRELLKMKGDKLRSWQGDIYQQFREAKENYGYK